MARIKPTMGKLESLEDVNIALRDIGLAENELSAIDNQMHKEISDIKTSAAKKGEPLRKFIAETSAKVQAFSDYNKADLFKDRKSCELSFGVFGYRKSTSISVKKTTLDLLHRFGFERFIRIKEEPDKEKMAELSDEDLEQVDASRKVKDDFFCESKHEEVNKELLKNAV